MFYKDGVSQELAPFWNLQTFVWSVLSILYTDFIFALFCGLVWYQTSGIYVLLTISAFIGIRIFELTLFCFLLTILLMKANSILCIFPKMTGGLLELELCFFVLIWNYKIFFKASYWVKEIVIKTEAGPFLVYPELDYFVMSWDLQWWFSWAFKNLFDFQPRGQHYLLYKETW